MSEKKRLDVYLAESGLAESREKAKAVIMSGNVYINSQRADKTGVTVKDGDSVEVRGGSEFVSRGGLKLKKALDFFSIDVSGKTALDAGASTGGFSDCLLKRGVEKLYAVDVGYGQLDWSIRTNPKVVCLERTNIRYITRAQIPDIIDIAVVDVSFISLKLVLPPIRSLMSGDGASVCLIKPQFEAGREKVGKKGVVRDGAVHAEVLKSFLEHACAAGFSVLGITHSPITGPNGNIEFLGHLSCNPDTDSVIDIEKVVSEAHCDLKG
ncbi:MAG: TlyA family RNA methyltransferase [Clostridiales bacterium]|nr:TlyA family RNA methyltransferase [Clostridiales bacterium]